jgi:hypothetical protein
MAVDDFERGPLSPRHGPCHVRGKLSDRARAGNVRAALGHRELKVPPPFLIRQEHRLWRA